jgi:predicted ATPase/DNA-binding SARP family transcriptional activator
MTTDGLSIRLLGGFAVHAGNGAVPEGSWRLRKGKALVKLVALAPDRRLHRDQAAELLWPDRDARSAANNFHQALHAARRALDSAGADGAACLPLRDDVLQLCPDGDLEVDVDAFEAAAAHARETARPADYETALNAYAGELLPEDRFEPWAAARREAASELHVALLLELAELHGEDGDGAGAIEVLQRAVVAAPLHEAAHRALMRRYAHDGRRQQALAQYQTLRAGLERELAADPDPETRALYREILAAAPEQPAGPTTNLPRQLTSFIGREREVAELCRLLGRHRLVTLTGPGGCGKTRLGIEVAHTRGEEFADGVWLAELAALGEAQLVPAAVAEAVGLNLPVREATAEVIAAQLEGRALLLVLDNCEHLIEACAVLVEALLRRCPEVRVLATSREPLRIGGELAWRVPSLSLPERRDGALADVVGAGAARLFAERAGLSLTDDNAAAVAELCHRLDGMPLAIELAAARASVLSPAQIAERLGQSLDVLGAGTRTAVTRQQTLRATLEWSHDLLDEEERTLFRRLAVFAGGFPLEAAEAVGAAPPLEAGAVLDVLTRLVDKSLVVAEEQASSVRYRLLEVIRQFARERLAAARETAAVEARHREWYIALLEDRRIGVEAAQVPEVLDEIEAEHDNLRAALASALRDAPRDAMRLAAPLWRFWLVRSHFAEGARWLDAVLEADREATVLRMDTLLGAGALDIRRGVPAQRLERAGESVEIARDSGDPLLMIRALTDLGLLTWTLGDYAPTERALGDAVELAAASGHDRWRASALHLLGIVASARGDYPLARERLGEVLALLATISDDRPHFVTFFIGHSLVEDLPGRPRMYFEDTIADLRVVSSRAGGAYALLSLAAVERDANDHDAARRAHSESLRTFRELGYEAGASLALSQLGNHARTLGEFVAGREWLLESLELRRRLGDRRAHDLGLSSLGALEAQAGDLERGRRLIAEAHRRFTEVQDVAALSAVFMNLGNVELLAADPARAIPPLERCWQLQGRDQVMPRVEGWMALTLADACGMAGDRQGAERWLEAARDPLELLGDRRGLAWWKALATSLLSERKEAPA